MWTIEKMGVRGCDISDSFHYSWMLTKLVETDRGEGFEFPRFEAGGRPGRVGSRQQPKKTRIIEGVMSGSDSDNDNVALEIDAERKVVADGRRKEVSSLEIGAG